MQFSFHLFILLFGFVLGNLFPTFFGDFLGKVGTPLFLFLALDFFNYFYYSTQKQFKIDKIQTSDNREAFLVEKTVPSKKTQGIMKKVSTFFNGNVFTKKTKQTVPFTSRKIRIGVKNSFLYSFSARANSFKIGFLFGLFVDAFKVGS